MISHDNEISTNNAIIPCGTTIVCGQVMEKGIKLDSPQNT